jgi:type I restriction enzyme S subunit
VSCVLDDVAELKGGFAFKSKDYSDSGRFILRTVNIGDGGRITREGATYIPESLAPEYERFELQEHDTLFVMVGATLGKVGYVSKDVLPALLNQNMWVIRSRDSRLCDSRFLNYWFRSIVGSTLQWASGSARGFVRRDDYRNIPFVELDIQDQQQIAYILSTLDDKIALNRKLNATLEARAQALFQSWFVDFDPVKAKLAAVRCGRDPEQAAMAAIACKLVVPPGKPKTETLDAQLPRAEAIDAATAALDELSEAQRQSLKEKAAHFPADFQESELGLIPQGWKVSRADQVVDISIGKTPPRKEPEWFTKDPENVRWVSIKDMGGLQTYSTGSSEYLTHEAVDKFNIKVIPKNSILLSFKLTLGRVAICDAPTATNEAIAHLIPRGPDCPFSTAYVYCYFKQFDYNMLASTSSIATAVNSKIIKAIPVITPNPNSTCLRAFKEDTSQVFEIIKNLNSQSRTLADLRDSLLPKLLNGEISVSSN